MTFPGPNHPEVKAAAERILALRRLTADTGVKTYRSQSSILESLSPEILAEVALLINSDKGTVTDNDHPTR